MSFVTDSILKTALGKIKSWGEGKFVAQESGKVYLQMIIRQQKKLN